MTEAEIQAWIARLIKNDALSASIDNLGQIKEQFKRHERYIESFPVDYLVRSKIIKSTITALDLIDSIEIVSADNNISLNVEEGLRPDFVLFNPERNCLIVAELKKSKQTERQAITELCGYEQEIKNHFPFLSNSDLIYIVISTEFSTLLDHAISSLVTWDSKIILCLKIIPSKVPGNDPRLSIHMPSPWNQMGQGLNFRNVLSVTLCLYPKDFGKIDKSNDHEAEIMAAFSLICREAERINSDGFAILWKDAWEGKISLTKHNITLGIINPFGFMEDAIEAGLINNDSSKICSFFSGSDYVADIMHPASIFRIGEAATTILEQFFSPMFEGLFTFDVEINNLSKRALPIRIDYWGAVGDYVRGLVNNRVALDIYPEIRQLKYDWTNPWVGIPMLYDMCNYGLFLAGKFPLVDIFNFGRVLGEIIYLCSVLKGHEEEMHLHSRLAFASFNLVAALRQVNIRINASPKLDSPPVIRIHSDLPTYRDSVVVFCSWFGRIFLNDNKTHAMYFAYGLNYFDIFSSDYKDVRENSVSDEEAALLCNEIKDNITCHVEDYFEVYHPIQWNEEFLHTICSAMSIDFYEDKNYILENIMSAEVNKVFDNIEGIILALDSMVGDVFHGLKGCEFSDVDWDWIKQQIGQMRSRGTAFPGIVITPDCSLFTAQLPSKYCVIGDVSDYENEVLVLHDLAGFMSIVKTKWEDLENGKLLNASS